MAEFSGIIEMYDYKQFLFLKKKSVSSLKGIILRLVIKAQAFMYLTLS